MDKVTRVKNAMDKKPVDRFPAAFWFHFMGERAQGETCVKAHLDYYRQSNIDYVKIMSDGFSMPHPLEISKASDWAKVRPAGKNSDFIQGQVERARRINEELNGECCTFYNVFTPFATFKNAVDRDMVAAHLREDPKSFRVALDAWAEDYATLAELVIGAGCTGAYIALQGAEVDFLKPEEYLDVVRDSDLRVINAANAVSGYNIAHLCAWFGIKNNLSVWQDYPVKAVNWAVYIEEMDLAQGRKFFGGEKCLIGGFDNRKTGVFYSGTKEEVQAEARNIGRVYTEKTGENTGMMIGADCTIWWEVDTVRMQWVMEALNNQ